MPVTKVRYTLLSKQSLEQEGPGLGNFHGINSGNLGDNMDDKVSGAEVRWWPASPLVPELQGNGSFTPRPRPMPPPAPAGFTSALPVWSQVRGLDAAAAKMHETGKKGRKGVRPGPLRWEDSWVWSCKNLASTGSTTLSAVWGWREWQPRTEEPGGHWSCLPGLDTRISLFRASCPVYSQLLCLFSLVTVSSDLPVLLSCPFLKLREVVDAQIVPEFEALRLLFLFLPPPTFLLCHLPQQPGDDIQSTEQQAGQS